MDYWSVLEYELYYKKRDNAEIEAELKNKTVFNLGGGFKKEDRLNPPKIGTIVTFKYYGFTKNGKPKFASFLRVREVE